MDKQARPRAAVLKRIFASTIFDAQAYSAGIVKNHYFWLLEYEYSLPQTHLIKIADEMLAVNASDYAQIFLMRLKDGALSVLRTAVSNAKADNKTRKLFVLFIDIAAGSSGVGGNRAKASEDLFVALSNRARITDNKDLERELSALRAAKSLDLNYARIEQLHNEEAASQDKFFELSMLTMFAFLNSNKTMVAIDKAAAIELFHEYKYTLSIVELQALNLILIATMLVYESGQIETQLQSLLTKYQDIFQNGVLRNTLLTAHTKEQKAQAIIKVLSKGEFEYATLNIINRIEKERLLYPKFIAYSGGSAIC